MEESPIPENFLGKSIYELRSPRISLENDVVLAPETRRMFEEAIAQGVDVFLSGEISEQTVHLARETGVAYIAAGHHVTERPGVRALAAHLAERFGLACEFVEIDNPV